MALMSIPSIQPAGPGGRIFESYNAVNQAGLDAAKKAIANKYAPMTLQADAASKLAYAKLMGPQFLAKLMGNKDILANVNDPTEITNSLISAGQGAGTGTNVFSPGASQTVPKQGSFPASPVSPSGGIFGDFVNWLNRSKQGMPEQQQQPSQQAAPVALEQPQQSQEAATAAPVPADSGYAYDKKGRNIVASPQEVSEAAYKKPTFAENVGKYEGITEEGKELGKARAESISDLDKQYQQAIEAEVPIKHMNEIVTNPIFQNMRNFPAFQGLQLNAKAKFGTPEEQKLIGDFQATAKKAVAQTVMGFGGRILAKEVDLSNQMKVADYDTIGVILGKLPSIETFNEMTKQRSRIASDLIQQKHISRGEALELADKQVDGAKIRNQINKELNLVAPPNGIDDTGGKMPPPGTIWMKSKKGNKYWYIHKDHVNDPKIQENLEVVD